MTPRDVPLTVALRTTFGGVNNVLGWIFLAVGAGILAFLLPMADVRSLTEFNGPLTIAHGLVTQVERTGITEGGSKSRPGRPVLEICFRFTDEQGQIHEGRSYGVDVAAAPNLPVRVEYPQGRPELARIEGLRTAPLPIWVLIFGLFAPIGLIFALIGVSSGRGWVRVLREGVLTGGELIKKEPTNTKINGRRVYRLTFRFQTRDGREATASWRTHEPEHLEDDEEERILYDPASPEDAVLIDGLPGKPHISPSGRIDPFGPFSLAILILPALGLTAVGFLLFRLLA